MPGGASASVRCASSLGVASLVHGRSLERDVGGGDRVVPALVRQRQRDAAPLCRKGVLRRVDVVAGRLEVDAGLGDVPGRDTVPRGLDRDQALEICVAGLCGIRPRRAERVQLGVGGAERLPALALVPVRHRGGRFAVVATVDRSREEAQAS